MIDPRVIQMLKHPDAERRRKAVTYLAKTKDRAALPHLQQVAHQDADESIRELAAKGSRFIEQHAPPPDEDDDLFGDAYDDIYDENDPTLEEDPLPEDLYVSEADARTARDMVRQALDMNVRGADQRAINLMERALRLDPRLMDDGYTVGLAATITGLNGQDAVRQLGPTPRELAALRERRPRQISPIQGLLAYSVIMGAVIVLLGYFLLPYVNLAAIPMAPDADPSTLGAALATTQTQLAGVEAIYAESGVPDEVQRFLDAVDGLTVSFSGLQVALLTVDASNLLDLMGFTALFDAYADANLRGLSRTEYNTALEALAAEDAGFNPLDAAVLLVPVICVVGLFLAVLLIRNATAARWVMVIVVGLLGVGALYIFFSQTVQGIIAAELTLPEVGALGAVPPAVDLVGTGFWMSLAGMVLIVAVPFFGLLTMPPRQ